MKFTLRQARMYREMTLDEMAEVLKVSQTTYRRYEARPEKFPASLLDRFSDAVRIPKKDIDFGKREEAS